MAEPHSTTAAGILLGTGIGLTGTIMGAHPGAMPRGPARAAEFAPLDVQATIPAQAAQAEAARETIRQKYAAIQTNIDAATVSELKTIIEDL